MYCLIIAHSLVMNYDAGLLMLKSLGLAPREGIHLAVNLMKTTSAPCSMGGCILIEVGGLRPEFLTAVAIAVYSKSKI